MSTISPNSIDHCLGHNLRSIGFKQCAELNFSGVGNAILNCLCIKQPQDTNQINSARLF